jgi:hypothetical protein
MSDVTGTYYAGEAFIGYGSQFVVGQDDGSPESFAAVADVMQIQAGEMSTAVVQKTHLRSPDRHHEKLATIRDSGPFTLSGNWRPSHGSQSNAGGDGFTSGGLISLWRNVDERNMKIILPIGSPAIEWPFRGVVTKFQPGTIGLEEKVDFTCEVTPLQAFDAELP